MSHIDQTLRISAEILAAAVLIRCPDAFIIEGGVTEGGFAYDFHFPSPFSKEMLPHIEQTFRELIAEDLPIHHREMIPENAATYFRHHKRFYPASFAKQAEGPLVDVLEMEGFVDLCPGPYLKTTGELEEIQILGISERPPIQHRGTEKTVLRIEGTLKKFLKKKKELQKLKKDCKNLYMIHRERGKDCREIQRCFWLPDGVKMRQEIREYWEGMLLKKGFEIVETQGENLLQNHENLFKLQEIDLNGSPWSVAEMRRVVSDHGVDPWEGLYNSKDYTFDQAHIFCLKKDLPNEIISSLQFLVEHSKILGFESTLELRLGRYANEMKKACETCGLTAEEIEGKETQLNWNLTDTFGRKWQGSFLKIEKKEETYILTLSLFSQIERLIALFLEWDKLHLNPLAKKRKFE